MSREDKYAEWLEEIRACLTSRNPQITSVELFYRKRSVLYFEVHGGWERYSTYWVDPITLENNGVEKTCLAIEKGLLANGWDKQEHSIYQWEFRYGKV